jgi:hypothetical protein
MLHSLTVAPRRYLAHLGFACRSNSGFTWVGFTANSRAIQRKLTGYADMLSTSTALSILAGHIQDPIPRNGTAVATHRRDMRKKLCATLLRLDKAKPFVIIPAA